MSIRKPYSLSSEATNFSLLLERPDNEISGLLTKYAAYNSEPKSSSRTGYVFFLGRRTDDFVNAPVDELSSRIDAVVTSAAEAQYAGLFSNSRKAVSLKQTLEALGHLQGNTPILTDDNSAVGLVMGTW